LPHLRRLGLEEVVRSGQRIRTIELQTPRSAVRFEIEANPHDLPFFVFPREAFDRLLLERARSSSARILEGLCIEEIIREGRRVVGARGHGMEIRAEVTVVATGHAGRVLSSNHGQEGRSYQALIGWFEDLRNLDPFVTESFTAPWMMGSGWVFPESPSRANVGIMVHADLLKEARKSLRDLFRAYCETPYFKKRLHGARQVGRLWGSPIRYALKPRGICDDGFLMVGEASLLTQPLTGEGISQAFQSAAVASEVIEKALASGQTTKEALHPYAQGVKQVFARNFWKAGLLRRWLDRPFSLHTAMTLAHGSKTWRRGLEKRLHRIVL